MSISTYLEPRILDAVFNNTSLAIANTYAKLHIANPGEACTANPAAETTRKLASFSAASVTTIVTDADLNWTSVAATEDYTHISFWDAATGGNALWYGPLLAAYHVNAGDTFVIPSGNVVITLD
jgi:hypothetical protein